MSYSIVKDNMLVRRNIQRIFIILILLTMASSAIYSTELEDMKLLLESNNDSSAYRDSWNLVHDASFQCQVGDGVWWVPASALGTPEYSNNQISLLKKASPDVKQELVATLYDAIMLFQLSGFRSSSDNIKIKEGVVTWEHHQPGEDAVRTNQGCCSANCSWLAYILKDDYEEMGFVNFTYPDGNGHVINYIKDKGFYYFIDLTQYRNSTRGALKEDGNKKTYIRDTNSLFRAIHKTESIETFIQYIIDKSGDNEPLVFTVYSGVPQVPPMAIMPRLNGSGYAMAFPESYKETMRIIDKIPDDNFTYYFHPDPVKMPDWSVLPSASFN